MTLSAACKYVDLTAPCVCRAEATDVANAVLDGVDGIMLGAETLRGKYPVEAVTTVSHLAQGQSSEQLLERFLWCSVQGTSQA